MKRIILFHTKLQCSNLSSESPPYCFLKLTANSAQQVLNLGHIIFLPYYSTEFAGLTIQNYTVMFFDCFFLIYIYMFKLNETVTEL
jgi:hypothetical protein